MSKPLTGSTSMADAIERRVDTESLSLTTVSKATGGITFNDMGQVMEFSKLMSLAQEAVPKHLRQKPGACLAVSLQAMNWRMDPFAVANKSYMVNDRIAYEAQLIHAVIEQRAPIKGRLKGAYEGEGAKRVCILTAISEEDGDTIEYRSPEIGSITTKNSPLWKSDPDQQLWYYSARAMCRRHFPDVLLGVYERDEIENAAPMKDVSPDVGGWGKKAMQAREPEKVEPDHDPDTGEVRDGFSEQVSEIKSNAKETQARKDLLRDTPPSEIEDAELSHDFDEDAVDPMTDEYDEGFTASKAGKGEDVCPHEPGTFEWNNWLGGYRFHAANAEVGDEA